MKIRTSAAIAALFFLLFVAPPRASAHAILVHSSPADHSVVSDRNVTLDLQYNSRIDASRCSLTLTDARGKSMPVQMEPAVKPAELKALANNLTNGEYRIHWQVLASDGHITRGDFTFTVAGK